MKLVFAPALKDRIREEFAPEMIKGQSDGSLVVELDCNLDVRVRQHLLTFGSDLEVVEPPSLRTWLADQARNLASLYAEDLPS